MEQVVIVPTRLEAFSFDTELGGFVALQQVKGDAVKQGKVLGGIAGAFAVEVFAEADIERPMQLVFNAPVLANGAVQPSGIGLEAGDVIAGILLRFAAGLVETFGLDAYQTL